ncbi:MAG: hypothetical protein K6F17_04330 [Lachnospiraceae bacterium]|nr:hypothetical protein [Lachnospiraceae bacterium]
MKKNILLITCRILNVITVIVTVIFMVINFENLAYYDNWHYSDSTKSLHVRYQYWLEDVYGTREGVEIYRRFRDFTVWIIEHHINEMIFAVIVLMMLVSIWINKKFNKKMNKVFKVYLILCIILMLLTIFVAGPDYVDSIFDA